MNIVISGQARSGKDTTAEIIQAIMHSEYGIDFRIRAYADDLKDRLARDFGLTYRQLYGDKEIPDFKYPYKDKAGEEPIEDKYWSPRMLLQFIGTDVYRRIMPDFWVIQLYNYIKNNPGNYIVSDARFENEISWVLDNPKNLHIRIVREGLKGSTSHLSETALHNYAMTYPRDVYLSNSGDSLKELESSIQVSIIPLILKNIGAYHANYNV